MSPVSESGRRLPLFVPVPEAPGRPRRIEGWFPLAGLARLLAACQGAAPDARGHARLVLRHDEQRRPVVEGSLEAELQVRCERCLRDYPLPLSLAVQWYLASSDAEAQRLLADCEPVLVEKGRLALIEAIEDELLLALPLSARCGLPDCRPGL